VFHFFFPNFVCEFYQKTVKVKINEIMKGYFRIPLAVKQSKKQGIPVRELSIQVINKQLPKDDQPTNF